MNSTPNTTATATPSSVPVKLNISVEFIGNCRQDEHRFGTPSRSTSRNTSENSPTFETVPAAPVYLARPSLRSRPSSTSPSALPMNQIIAHDEDPAATSITQPSNHVGVEPRSAWKMTIRNRHARQPAPPPAPRKPSASTPAARSSPGRQRYDPHDQRSLHALTQRDDECLQHCFGLDPRGPSLSVIPGPT